MMMMRRMTLTLCLEASTHWGSVQATLDPDPGGARELYRSVIGALIRIPYFLVSKRVQATFIR